MSLRDTQNFLARIYTDENLRRQFFETPETIGKSNNLTEQEIAELTEILPAELNFFAESLFYKRLRETEKMLPSTVKILGKIFESNFREFAPTFNPQTVKKHLEDAVAFAEFLQNATIAQTAKNAAKFERARLLFYSGTKNFIFERFDTNIKQIVALSPENLSQNIQSKNKLVFAVWIRIGKFERQFIL